MKEVNKNKLKISQINSKRLLFRKIWMPFVGILAVCIFTIIPIVSAQTFAIHTSYLIATLNEYENVNAILWAILSIVGISSLLIYLLPLILFVTKGFDINLVFVVSVVVISGGLVAYLVDRGLGVGGTISFMGFGIFIGWIGISIIAFLLTFVHCFWSEIGSSVALFLSGFLSIALPFVLINTPPVSPLTEGIITSLMALAMITGARVISWQALKGSSVFNWIIDGAIALAAEAGVSLYGLDLTDACFDGMDLRYVDFRKSNLTHASFRNARGLDLARLRGTILEQKNVRDLLTSSNGYGKDFTEADLSGADLRGVNLGEAILSRVQLLNADLSGACLTDACIQDWNINHNTRFNNVDCKRVYLKRSPNGHFLEPKPDSGEFGPGEFEKWITDVRDTIDLIFQNGLNWRAFAFSLTQTAINNEGIDLSVRSIENKGDGVVVAKVGVSLDTNKTSIHQEITEHYNGAVAAIAAKYELVLKAKDDEIDRLVAFHETQQRFIQGLVSGIAEPKEKVLIQGEGNRVYVMNQAGDVMENSNQNINAGGNVDMSTGARVSIGGDVTGSSINLGELSGQVTNTIQQLQDIKTTDGNDLARILTQLQKSINEDQALSDAQKEQALEAVATLAEEGKKPPESRTAKFCSMAINALKGLASSVADVSKLAEMLQTSLPTLTKLLGL